MLIARATLLVAPGLGFVLAAALLGGCSAAALALALASPPLVAERSDVPRVAAGMLAVGYCLVWLVLLAARESVDRPRQQVERIRGA
jgi:hypothetical protein